MADEIRIRAQPGPQRAFLSTPADIAIIGGGNDGGKTYALLMDAARHQSNPNFTAVFFRRETPQITNPDGLWDGARRMYASGCDYTISPRHQCRFPSGARITFAHMQHVDDRFSFDGSQIPGIYFDQLEQFEEEQFWHLLGRNRSDCGVKPYVRASCNPRPDCWLSKLLQWWWDTETGYAIPERSGVIRWFVRDGDELIWFDSPEEARRRYPDRLAKSFTFVVALIFDNKIALEKNPDRLANLQSQGSVEMERRVKGNWKVKDITGDGLIKLEWWAGKYIEPRVWQLMQERLLIEWKWKRGWDLAAGDSKGADYTVGALIGKHRTDGRRLIADIVRGKWTPGTRNDIIAATIKADQRLEAMNYIWRPTMNTDMHRSVSGALQGLPHQFVQERGSKLFRAQSWAPQVEAGNYYMVQSEWNNAVVLEGAQFTGEPSTETRKDDIIDAICLADKMHTEWG